MTIDEAIQEAVRNGLQGLTLFRSSEGRWQASTSRDRLSWQCHTKDDPVDAIRQALGAPAVSDLTTNPLDKDIFS